MFVVESIYFESLIERIEYLTLFVSTARSSLHQQILERMTNLVLRQTHEVIIGPEPKRNGSGVLLSQIAAALVGGTR